MKTLIIIPTYNEKENIESIIEAVFNLGLDINVLVVDDNSPDGTGNIADELSAKDSRVHVLHRKGKEGLGRAYIDGFKWALKHDFQYIFEMDADFSHDPKYVPKFLENIRECDLVIGSRYKDGVNVINWPMSRLLLSFFGNVYARMVTGIPISDSTGGFKCFRRSTLESLDLDKISSSGYSFQIEVNYMVWKRKLKIQEIPIVFVDRKSGTSKMSSSIVKEAISLLIRLRILNLFKSF
jgi:dolichol-phosphate mannosyltransferase